MSYRRSVSEKKRLLQIYRNTEHSCGNGVWYDEDKNRYIRYYRSNPWLKIHARRIARNTMKRLDRDKAYNSVPLKSNLYRKYYDYWMALY